jgi:hypothetical protein
MAGKKYLINNAGNFAEEASIQTSAGAGDAGKIAALDSTGRIDNSMMPLGLAVETKSIIASEALSAGDFVNVYNNAGTLNCRKADATSASKRAHGFVLAAVSSGASATVYYGNLNNQKSAMTIGAEQYLSGSAAGGTVETPPTATGNLVQRVGVALSATEMLVEIQPPIQLA